MIDINDFMSIECPIYYSVPNRYKKVICVNLFPNGEATIKLPPIVSNGDFESFLGKTYLACLKKDNTMITWDESHAVNKSRSIYYSFSIQNNGDATDVTVKYCKMLDRANWYETIDHLKLLADFNDKLAKHNIPVFNIYSDNEINNVINVGTDCSSDIIGEVSLTLPTENLRNIVLYAINKVEAYNVSKRAISLTDYEFRLDRICRDRELYFLVCSFEEQVDDLIDKLEDFYRSHIDVFNEEDERDECFEGEFNALKEEVSVLGSNIYNEKLHYILRHNYKNPQEAKAHLCRFFSELGDYCYSLDNYYDEILENILDNASISQKKLDVFDLETTDKLIDYIDGLRYSKTFWDLYHCYYDENKTDGYSYDDD